MPPRSILRRSSARTAASGRAATPVTARKNATRSSNARFWVVLAVLIFLTVVFALTAWREIQTTFGI